MSEIGQNNPAVVFENVTAVVGETPVLEDITFSVPELDFLGIIGPNGAGKTTLLRAVLGLVKPAKGKITVFGRSPEEGRRLAGYVPQVLDFDTSFPIDVFQIVLSARLDKRLFGRYSAEDRRRAEEALAAVGLSHLARRPLSRLSGGERQRVLIARALARRPRLLLLDEPAANVDLHAEFSLYQLLQELNKEITIILVTHDLGVVSSYVKTTACLNRRLVCHGFENITPQMIQKLYGHPVDLVSHGIHRRFVLEKRND